MNKNEKCSFNLNIDVVLLSQELSHRYHIHPVSGNRCHIAGGGGVGWSALVNVLLPSAGARYSETVPLSPSRISFTSKEGASEIGSMALSHSRGTMKERFTQCCLPQCFSASEIISIPQSPSLLPEYRCCQKYYLPFSGRVSCSFSLPTVSHPSATSDSCHPDAFRSISLFSLVKHWPTPPCSVKQSLTRHSATLY